MRLTTIILVLLLVLSACTTTVLAPPSQLVEKAIALQLQKTQQQLNQQLDLNFQGFQINHLSITQEKPPDNPKSHHLPSSWYLQSHFQATKTKINTARQTV